MRILCEKEFKGNIIITDPLYVVKQDKFEDPATKPKQSEFYPENWTAPTEEDYFNNTEKALIAKRCELNYNQAVSEWRDALPNDWDICNYGNDMNHLGFKNYLISDTVYGLWSCSTFRYGDDELIGKFISDSGLVGVFYLDEILSYNPTWDIHLSKPYCACMIPEFQGNITIANLGGSHTSDSDVRVIGKGSLNFYTKQTGF